MQLLNNLKSGIKAEYIKSYKAKGIQRTITNDFLNKSVGALIHSFASSRGLTQVQAAEKIGVSKQVYFKIIKGKRVISFVEVMKVIEAYDTTPVIFFNRLKAVKVQNIMRVECSEKL